MVRIQLMLLFCAPAGHVPNQEKRGSVKILVKRRHTMRQTADREVSVSMWIITFLPFSGSCIALMLIINFIIFLALAVECRLVLSEKWG